MTGADDVARALRRAGVEGWAHVADIDTGAEVDVGADVPVALASTFKLPVLVALHREADAGRVDLAERVLVPVAGRTPGATGLGALWDDAELSLRDLAQLMITVSDNAAADAVIDRIGLPAVDRALAELGLATTAVPHACRDLHALLAEDLGPLSQRRPCTTPRRWPACGRSTRRRRTGARPGT